jgi:hypothetical protein
MDDAELRHRVRFGGKPEYRAIMRKLSMPDKVRVIVELQKDRHADPPCVWQRCLYLEH